MRIGETNAHFIFYFGYKMRCKSGVTPMSLWIMAAISRIDAPVEIVITAGTNGKHSLHSLHGSGNALDIRTNNFPSEVSKNIFKQRLEVMLGPDYDVLFEDKGLPNEHIHVEFDPES